MNLRRLAPGLWRWLLPHPDWKPSQGGRGGWERSVSCLLYKTPGTLLLIDPLAPAKGAARERFWARLERLSRGRKTAVLLGSGYHRRSCREIRERLGAPVWACAAASRLIGFRPDRTLREETRLPEGLRAMPVPGYCPDELVFWLPGPRALAVSDALIGAGAGRLRVAPASWTEGGKRARGDYSRRFRTSLRRLLKFPARLVVPGHGAPVLKDGRRALAEALEAPPWGV